MRLLTHNMLQCPRTKSYPLVLTAKSCDDVEVPFSETFIRRMLARLDWRVFREAAEQLPDQETISLLPREISESEALDDTVLKAIHRALLEWHVVEGVLESGDGTLYMVSNGIPNLVTTEVRKVGTGAMDEGDTYESPSNNIHSDAGNHTKIDGLH